MSSETLKLSCLRDIGWTRWDPIGLLALGEAWSQQPFADEYDEYLRKVEVDLRSGVSLKEAVAYLVRVEREHMALGVRPEQEARADATVRAIQLLVQSPA